MEEHVLAKDKSPKFKVFSLTTDTPCGSLTRVINQKMTEKSTHQTFALQHPLREVNASLFSVDWRFVKSSSLDVAAMAIYCGPY